MKLAGSKLIHCPHSNRGSSSVWPIIMARFKVVVVLISIPNPFLLIRHFVDVEWGLEISNCYGLRVTHDGLDMWIQE